MLQKHNNQQEKRMIVAGIIGNIIEYYDFALIGFLAVIMGRLFFPSHDPFLSLLGSFGAFAAGMIMRPLGALVFGHLGDKIGRRFALMSSLALMALPTFFISILPTYSQIGIMAPLLLVILRMIQGLSVGGEYASSIVYLVEQSPPQHHNLYGAFVSVGAKIGMVLGSGVCGLLLWSLGEESMSTWGWRIPFALSIVIAMAGLYLRRSLVDDYQPPHDKRVPIVEIWHHHRKIFLRYLVIASSIWLFYYTLFVYLPVWLEGSAHLTKVQASRINTISIVMGAIFIPVMAMVADRWGGLKVMRYAGSFLALGAYPLFYVMSLGDETMAIYGAIIMAILLSAFQAPIFATTVYKLSYHGYRATFTAVILGSAAGIVGGMAPAVMSIAVEWSGNIFAPAYLVTMAAIVGWMILLGEDESFP